MADIVDEDGAVWLTALEAAQRLTRRFGGLTIAKHALAEGLREGLLTAAADGCQIIGNTGEPQEHEGTVDQLLDVPTEVFSQSTCWDSDRLGWDWEIGAFDVTLEESSYAFIGVHFLASDVEAIDPEASPYRNVLDPRAAAAQRRQERRERTAAVKWNWERPLADLVALADLDGLEEAFDKPFERGFQKKLEDWFRDWFMEREGDWPSDAERRRRATQVVEAMERLKAARARK